MRSAAAREKKIAPVRSEFIERSLGSQRARRAAARAFFAASTFRIAGRENLAPRFVGCTLGQPREIYCRPSLALRAEVGLSSRNSLLHAGTSRQLLTPRKVYFEKCTANAGLLAARRKTFHASRSSLCNFVHYTVTGPPQSVRCAIKNR